MCEIHLQKVAHRLRTSGLLQAILAIVRVHFLNLANSLSFWKERNLSKNSLNVELEESSKQKMIFRGTNARLAPLRKRR